MLWFCNARRYNDVCNDNACLSLMGKTIGMAINNGIVYFDIGLKGVCHIAWNIVHYDDFLCKDV